MLSCQFILSASLWTLFLPGSLASPTPVGISVPLSVRQETPQTPQSNACGLIVDDVNAGYAYHYASDAYACLISVPLNSAVATRFIKYINDTIQFQSTLAYLKNPPTGYQQPAVDIISELEKIQNNVTAQVYQNQYQFEMDVQHVLYKAHDAHLYLSGGVTSAFSFQSPYSITAASADGKSLPEVYITNDIIKARGDTRWKPSPIKTINGEDAVEYLTRLASLNAVGGIEPHADWNQLFYTPALSTQGIGSIWDSNIKFYPGDSIELVMKNGTKYFDYWLALWNEPFATGPLTTGGDFYNYFVLGLLPASYEPSEGFFNPAYTPKASSGPAVAPEHSWRRVSHGAYPDPDVQQEGLAVLEDGVVSGYFLSDADAAVLSIPSFGQSGQAIDDFSGAVSNFISNVTKENLTRVVIDLQQNTGGTVELAFSTFRRFFPNKDPFAGSRRRNHHLGSVIGEAYTTYFDGLTAGDVQYNDFLADEWVATSRLNAATGENFTSWAEYSGPVQTNGDSFSLTERYNLSNYDFAAALFEGWVPRGYTVQEPLSYSEPPFDAKDIVILTDGACSSTCALLVEMFTQAGVKTVTAGGRPSTGPMQAVGGNRGAVLYSADQIDNRIETLSNPAFGVDETVLATVPQLTDFGFRDSGVYTAVLGINLRDQVRPDDTVPLQFKYEAADCRIFYTLKNVYNMPNLWRDTVTAAFDDPSLCVEGSTGFTNASKPAPEPIVTNSISPAFSFSAPDTVLIDNALDQSGGPQDKKTQAFSTTITACLDGDSCQFRNQRCEVVDLRVCNTAYTTVKAARCVPYSTGSCPVGTVWKVMTADTLRLKWNEDAYEGRDPVMPDDRPLSITSTGACFPAIGYDSRICY